MCDDNESRSSECIKKISYENMNTHVVSRMKQAQALAMVKIGRRQES